MFSLPADLTARIATRHSIVTLPELRQVGIPDHAIRRAVTSGTIVRMHAGVYRFAISAITFEARCAAACLADADAIITGPAAARLWGFRHVFRPEHPIVAVPHDRSPLNSGVLLRRTNVLDPTDWVSRTDAIRAASPPRAWFDCARDLDDVRFEKLTEWLLDHHATAPTLWATRRRLNQRGRPGLARVNRVLSQREVWQKPAGSGLELDVLNALGQRGLLGIIRQHPIRLPDGVLIHPDGAIPSIRWAVEIDHVTWHGGRSDAQRDKGRDRKLRRVGWQVDRVTDQELGESFERVITELVELAQLRQMQMAA